MKLEIKSRDRRALLLLTGALVLYFAATELALPAYDRIAAAEEEALDKESQLLRYRRALARKSDYRTLLENARSRMDEAEASLIAGENPTLASSEMQTMVETMAAEAGIELGQRSLSALRSLDDHFNEITMNLSFESTPGQLVRFLDALRTADRFVTVRSIQVVPVQPMDRIPAPETLTALSKDLRVGMTVGAVLAARPEPVDSPGGAQGAEGVDG